MANHQVLAIQALQKKIYEEAKQRYEEEQNKPAELKVSE
jgi:hypothetical protein